VREKTEGTGVEEEGEGEGKEGTEKEGEENGDTGKEVELERKGLAEGARGDDG
jgi:hypothetical protein